VLKASISWMLLPAVRCSNSDADSNHHLVQHALRALLQASLPGMLSEITRVFCVPSMPLLLLLLLLLLLQVVVCMQTAATV
jgi:hypothetical protein